MLYGWMKSIVIYLILSGIVINFAPSNSYKKYINFFMGLMLLIIVSKPLSLFFNFGEDDVNELMYKVDSYLEYNEDSNIGQEDFTYYDASLEESMESLVRELGYDIHKVAVITDDDYRILKCTLYVKADQYMGAEDETLIKNNISDVYNVEVDNINIVSR